MKVLPNLVSMHVPVLAVGHDVFALRMLRTASAASRARDETAAKSRVVAGVVASSRWVLALHGGFMGSVRKMPVLTARVCRSCLVARAWWLPLQLVFLTKSRTVWSRCVITRMFCAIGSDETTWPTCAPILVSQSRLLGERSNRYRIQLARRDRFDCKRSQLAPMWMETAGLIGLARCYTAIVWPEAGLWKQRTESCSLSP